MQGFGKWYLHGAVRLIRRERYYPALDVNAAPRQPGKVAQALSGVESQQDHAAPFIVADIQDLLQFRHGQRPALGEGGQLWFQATRATS